MTSLNYFSNFDDTLFAKVSKNEFNRSIDDECAIQQRNNDNSKKLKFITTNHIDLLDAKTKLYFFGISVKDQLFVPGNQIDNYSSLLNGDNGGKLSNCNVRNGLGELPISTTPYRGQLHHGNIDIEDQIRNNIEVRKNACLPRDANYQNRSFYIFDDTHGIETPKPIMSVETRENGFNGRVGISSRFVKNKYTS